MTTPISTTLREILGPDRVRDDAEALSEFSGDRTENPRFKPDLVVYPTSAEDVQAVLREANRSRTPVVPVVAATNLGGLTIPVHGGIILNLSRMNRILEISEDDLYAVIEPGVTWQQISDHLARHHPSLRFAYPLSPPDSGVTPNFIMDGLINLSLRHGSAAHWINSLEVVLPSGELLRTGQSAFSSIPCTNSPFPPLESLFVGFQSRTGVVVKLSVQLWPNRRLRKRLFFLAYNEEQAVYLLRRLAHEDIADDLAFLSWATGKMLFGEYRPTFRDPHEPLAFIYADISSNFESDLHSKEQILLHLAKACTRDGTPLDGPLSVTDLVALEPAFDKFANFPTRLDFLLDHPGGGLTWVGTYGPMSRLAEGFRRGCEIMDRYRLPPVVVVRPMKGAHFAVLRFITIFDRTDPADTDLARRVNADLADMAVDLGFFPYKTPQWIWERFADRIDPTFRRLVRDVCLLLDPHQIMNPGHLEIPIDDSFDRT